MRDSYQENSTRRFYRLSLLIHLNKKVGQNELHAWRESFDSFAEDGKKTCKLVRTVNIVNLTSSSTAKKADYANEEPKKVVTEYYLPNEGAR